MEKINIFTGLSFNTKRLTIDNFSYFKNNLEKTFLISAINILSPNVTKLLPDGWQNINTISTAKKWIKERNEESIFLIIKSSNTSEIIGFIFLFPIDLENDLIDLRFGYLLSESFWGKGLGTEVVKGLVNKCQELGYVKSIFGGVGKDNIGSIKVLEKCGFETLNANEDESVIFYQYLLN
ncbi:GNAT family N-acetyltransferase [Tenacibaculum singaporense]|uniref:GNAT family N-acetyltransferase n=1 Tax=Tenacibaculum singaporense TaxID=2358479 RepID=UPI000F67C09B|nr:GNAT family N-acetyltransferase [Tenacibaculum singaporense]RSC93106.1 N-acetyltransferase [Tenacibaculum singaporense]